MSSQIPAPRACLPNPGANWREPVTGYEFVWLESLSMWVGKYMVANGDYRRFRPSHNSGDFRGLTLDGERQPAAWISYNDATAFCDWLSQADHSSKALPENYLIRVPSHKEWTAYARCGDGRTFPWGEDWPPTMGNYGDAAGKRAFPDWETIEGYDDGFAVSCDVEKAGENPWGLVGVGGNAYEWTFEADGLSCDLRGGSWSTNQREYLMINNRYRREPSGRLVNFGFRMVMTRI